MKKVFMLLCSVFVIIFMLINMAEAKEFKISKAELMDKIKGAWATQVIGVTFGGPTEFRFQGTLIPDYQPITWNETLMKWFYDNAPGLYDDIYMDLTFVEVFEKEGIDAPVESHAKAYANAEYMLWHANLACRDNLRAGIAPPYSGHPKYNSHADDIDYQIEADYSGLIAPGIPQTGIDLGENFGRLMN